MNSEPIDNPPSYEEATKINPNATIPSISSKGHIIVEQPKLSAPPAIQSVLSPVSSPAVPQASPPAVTVLPADPRSNQTASNIDFPGN